MDGLLPRPRRLAVGRGAVLRMLLAEHGSVPMVVTVAGYVISGTEVVGVSTDDGRPPRTALETRPAAAWFDAFEERRLVTGPGDPWLFWRCPSCPPIPRDRPRRTA